ncbi:MAG TPA: DUF362 domain-containing protein [Anaerolineaceae bacterium]
MHEFIAKTIRRKMERREFLRWLGGAGVTLVAAACAPFRAAELPTAAALPPSATPSPTVTATPFSAISTATRTPPTATPDPRIAVAIGKATAYDPAVLRAELEKMLEGISGPGDWIKPGVRVGIKVNLTGEATYDGPGKIPANELFVTHPAVVEALGEILKDAGARELVIVDGLGDVRCFDRWGFSDVAKRLGAELVDLCKPAPYKGYKLFQVGKDPLIYDHFYLNGRLSEIDGLISVAKLKCHSTTGVTLSMKNLIGLAPISEYRRHEVDNNRSFFHGDASHDTRLPGVIMDLNRAVPVRLALIDGVMTAEGGAGPWQDLSQVKPGVLLVGKDPVATDAVATAVMGFDPQAPAGSLPFLHGENTMEMAHALGLGTNVLNEIRVSGPAIAEVKYPFKPAP